LFNQDRNILYLYTIYPVAETDIYLLYQ